MIAPIHEVGDKVPIPTDTEIRGELLIIGVDSCPSSTCRQMYLGKRVSPQQQWTHAQRLNGQAFRTDLLPLEALRRRWGRWGDKRSINLGHAHPTCQAWIGGQRS
jgi:hypothetical protein